jgi:carbamoyltransferase
VDEHVDSAEALCGLGDGARGVGGFGEVGEEERFNRVKHWAGFPAESIRYCLAHAGITGADLDHVAVSFNPGANLGKKILFTLNKTPSLKSILDRLNRQSKGLGLRENLALALGCDAAALRAEIHNVEHHASHIGSAFLVSPFER